MAAVLVGLANKVLLLFQITNDDRKRYLLCYDTTMVQKNASSRIRGVRFVVGTKHFEIVSTAEGIKPSIALQNSVRRS